MVENLDVRIDQVNVGLSERAFDFLLDLLDTEATNEADVPADAIDPIRDYAAKLAGELRTARDHALSQPQSGITPEVRKAAGMKIHEVTDAELAAASPTYAEHVADKMAKAARKAVGNDA